MTQPTANPYAPPNADLLASATRIRDRQLLPLWIWLAIAVLTSFLGTPADPISLLIALAYGLVSFCVGAMLGSSLNMIVRVLPVIFWAIPAIFLAISSGGFYFFVGAVCCGLASIMIGFWSCRRIQRGRLRILAWFCAGYILGSIVGALGTVAGAVLGAILAKRSLPRPDGG